MRYIAIALLLLLGCLSCRTPPISIPQETQEAAASWKKIVDVSDRANRLLIYSYAEPCLLLDEKCIQGSGISAMVVNRKAHAVVYGLGVDAGADELIIDYSEFDQGVLAVTESVWDGKEAVPFVAQTITLGADGTIAKQEELVLKPEVSNARRIYELLATIITSGNEEGDDQDAQDAAASSMEASFYELLQIAVSDPDSALAALDALRGELDEQGDDLLAEFSANLDRIIRLISGQSDAPLLRMTLERNRGQDP